MAYGDGFDISAFKTQLHNGLVKPSLYQVDFTSSATLSNKLSFFTDNFNIPSIDLDTQMIRRYGYGPIEYVPFRPIFGPISMSFMVEAEQENVLYDVIGTMSATSPFMNYNTLNDGVPLFGGAGSPYEVAYKGDVVFNLSVYIYNESQQKITTVSFRDCFVKSIGSINLSWASTDQYLKTDVTFIATNYSISTADADSSGNAGLSNIGTTHPQSSSPSQFVNDTQNIASASQIAATTITNPGAGGGVSTNSLVQQTTLT